MVHVLQLNTFVLNRFIMQKLTILSLLILLFTSAIAQLQICTTPVSDIKFRQNMRLISSQSTEQQKMIKVKYFTSSNCFTSIQVKEMASVFYDDNDRLEYCMLAYGRTVDSENFYEVYNTFAYFSTVFRLHDYIKGISSGRMEDMPHPERNLPEFPPYKYPQCYNYDGAFNCHNPMSDQQYISLLFNVINQNDDASRNAVAIALAKNNCFSVAQVMKTASLIRSEKARLGFLKGVYPYTYDLLNFSACEQTLEDESLIVLFNQFLAQMHAGHSVDPLPQMPCAVNHQEFADICKTINSQSFSNTKITLAKQIISSKGCFTAQQIKEIMGLFNFESARLEIAKFAYNYTSDKENYYLVNDAFSFSSSIDELDKFLKGQ